MTDTQQPLTGSITVTRGGIGFIDTGAGEDLIVRKGDTGQALSKDIVAYERAGKEGDRPAARVINVIERHQDRFVGRIVQDNGTPRIQVDGRVHTPFIIPEGAEAPENHKVILELASWDEDQNLPVANITEVIGPVGDHETEMRALLLREGFDAEFPADVRKEAEELEEQGGQLLEKGKNGRRDLRGTTTFTIDPKTAKDFDDALSIKKLEDGKYEIGVHIADVSYFVTPGTAIDTEARRRATSVYLVDRTIPMLPLVLSENLCSLRPEEDRLAMSAIFIIDENAKVHDAWYGETIIHSDKRFTYEEAQESLTQGGLYHDELVILNDLAHQIRKRRTKKGAVSFETEEVQVEIDEQGTPIDIHLKERQDTNLLIEDFMLLANESVATYMSKVVKESGGQYSFVYRIHDNPHADRIQDLAEFVDALGYKLETQEDGSVSGKSLNELFTAIEDAPEEDMIRTAAVRSMAKAIYTTKNIGHFGLAFQHYTHFTSPIRRYPDLMVHRLIKRCIADHTLSDLEIARLEEDAIHATEREISATQAERDSIKLKQVEYLSKHIGEEFDAVISGVFEKGFFVQEKTTHAEGLIHIRTLEDDYYTYEESKYRLVGSNTGKAYQLGDEVRVRLTNANPIERQLDFKLAPKK